MAEDRICQHEGCWKRALLKRDFCWGDLDDVQKDSFKITVELHQDDLAGENLRGANLSGIDLSRANLEGANLSDTDLHGTDLSGAKLKGADLSHALLPGAILDGRNLCGAILSSTDLSGAKIRKAGLQNADLTEANLEGADLSESALEGADLTKARLDRAKLDNAKLDGARLADASLREASLKHASLKSILEGWNLDLRRADLFDANLEGSNIWHSDLHGANLTDVNLTGGNIRYCRLYGADFTRARVDRADLREIKQVEYKLLVALDSFRLLRWLVWPRLIVPFIQLYRRARNHKDEKKGLPKRHFSRKRSLDLATRLTRFVRWRNRERQTKWAGVSGVETSIVDDSLTRRYIKDTAYIEDFRTQHGFSAFWWRWTCFYGRSFGLWAFWCLFATTLFALIYFIPVRCCGYYLLDVGCYPKQSFWSYFYRSVVAFMSLGLMSAGPIGVLGHLAVLAEVILGYIGLGGLISILANKVARRA